MRNARRGWGCGLVPGLKEWWIVGGTVFGMGELLEVVGDLVLFRRK